jgi:GTP pyrophosphokinase
MPHLSANPISADLASWLTALPVSFTPSESGVIRLAAETAAPVYADQFALTGTPLLQHALGAASILIGMNMDHETVSATLLHAVPAYVTDWHESMTTKFGSNIVRLIEGIARMEQIRQFSEMQSTASASGRKEDDIEQIESLRKMLLAMVEDIRVVLIKLAERTQTMRNLYGATAEQQLRIARETQGIFAPLANRLGVWQVKWELEDLSLRYLEPDLYKKVARLLDEKRVDRERYIADIVAQLQAELASASIKAEVSGRPKHINSIINKMKRKGVDFNALYDVRAVRILVADVKDCYAALGLVHNLWKPISGEFDDYIAHPKSNGYKSLHTALIGPRGLAMEVQIRTHEMHHNSELGVAAHWRYKEGKRSDASFDAKIVWLRQILEWKEDVAERGDLLEQFKNELFHDQVYVLTPQGKVIDLPKGATPVDFAYTLHTDLGHRTRGAKVDGSIVPLNYKLQNGQCVDILTAKQGAPSRDWLNPTLGYLQSSRARAKVRHWFRYQSFDENVSQGRAQLDRELNRLGLVAMNQEKISQRLHFNKLEDFLAAIGRGDVTSHQIATVIQDEMPSKMAEPVKALLSKSAAHLGTVQGILIEGVDNLLTKMAKCCQPAPPDSIVGYVTRDHGVTVHRRDCLSMLRLPESRRDRMLNAQWGNDKGARFAADIEIEANDRRGLLRDITELFAHEKVNVTKVNTQSEDDYAHMSFSVEIADLGQLSRLLGLLNQVENVISARRKNK